MSREKALALRLGTTLASFKHSLRGAYQRCRRSLWLGAISLGGQDKYHSVWATITNYHVSCDLQITSYSGKLEIGCQHGQVLGEPPFFRV